jgi:choline monooxygenase
MVLEPALFMFKLAGTCMQDGGYHVPYAHTALASGLDLSGYSNELHEVLSIQTCSVKQGNTSSSSSSSGAGDCTNSSGSSSSSSEAQLDRLAGGRDAAYAFVYPNLMINRYG